MARELDKLFKVGEYNALRLMRTETQRVQTEVAKDSMIANGNTHYEYLATGANPCDICEGLDGEVFPISEMQVGKNAPPMHPNSHCTIAPRWDEEKYQRWLDSGASATGVGYNEFEEIDMDETDRAIHLSTDNWHGDKAVPYSERGIEIDDRLKDYLNKLKNPSDYIRIPAGRIQIYDLAVLSSETGVEYTHLHIGNEDVLVRGKERSTTVPRKIAKELKQKHGTLESHSHPYEGDLVPSKTDRDELARLTWQACNNIIEPTGKIATYDKNGVIETGVSTNTRPVDYYESIWGEWRC